jgi:hypothetical protein
MEITHTHFQLNIWHHKPLALSLKKHTNHWLPPPETLQAPSKFTQNPAPNTITTIQQSQTGACLEQQ